MIKGKLNKEVRRIEMFSDIFTGIEKQKKLDAYNNNLLKIKPRVDIYETENAVVVLAEMPNVDKENLQVSINKGVLQLSGKRVQDLNDGNYLLRETGDIIYQRFFELEDNLNPEKIQAEYNAGILKVIIGKREKAKTKKIEIK